MQQKNGEASKKRGETLEKEAERKKRLAKAIDFAINKLATDQKAMKKAEFLALPVEEKRKIFEKIAIRGEKYEVNGREGIAPDLDGKGVLALLREAGIEVNDLIQVGKSEKDEYKSRIVFNTRGVMKEGVQDENEALNINPDGNAKNSCTKFAYEILVGTGVLKQTNELDKFVEFVTEENNKDYDQKTAQRFFKNYAKSLRGLQYYIGDDDILEAFREAKKTDKILDDDFLDKHFVKFGKHYEKLLSKVAEDREGQLKQTKSQFEKLKKDFIVDGKYGKVLIDIHKKNKNGEIRKGFYQGFDGARNYGCDAYLSWSPAEGSFMFRTSKSLEKKFSQGHLALPNMWMKERGDGETLNITLQEVLEKIAGSDFEARGKLKDFLEREKYQKENAERIKNILQGYQELFNDDIKYLEDKGLTENSARLDDIKKKIQEANNLSDEAEKLDIFMAIDEELDKFIEETEKQKKLSETSNQAQVEMSEFKKNGIIEKEKFTEEERTNVDLYMESAKSIVDYIRKIDFEKHGYEKSDVPTLIEINIKRYWNILKQEIEEDILFKNKDADAILKEIKNQLI